MYSLISRPSLSFPIVLSLTFILKPPFQYHLVSLSYHMCDLPPCHIITHPSCIIYYSILFFPISLFTFLLRSIPFRSFPYPLIPYHPYLFLPTLFGYTIQYLLYSRIEFILYLSLYTCSKLHIYIS